MFLSAHEQPSHLSLVKKKPYTNGCLARPILLNCSCPEERFYFLNVGNV